MHHWQHIPFCIDVLRRIAPARVIDVGSSTSAWAPLLREFCPVPAGHGSLHIERILPPGPHASSSDDLAVDQVHQGAPAAVLASLASDYDAALVGALEAMGRDEGLDVLGAALAKARYAIALLPLGGGYAAPGSSLGPEGHAWSLDDLHALPIVRRWLGSDHASRPFACVVLSRDDPADVRGGTFGADGAYDTHGSNPAGHDAVDRAIERVAEVAFELDFIKKSRTYHLAQSIRRSAPVRLSRRWLRGGSDAIEVLATGLGNAKSKGSEVWLLEAHLNAGEPALPWDYIHRSGDWVERHEPAQPYGKCLIASRGALEVPAGANPELVFLSHPWSGVVRVTAQGRTEEFDLYSEHGGRIRLNPFRNPMLVASTSNAPLAVAAPAAPRPAQRLTDTQQAFVQRVLREKPAAVAVHCPRWLGVTNSTKNLFEHLLPVPESPAQEPYHLTDDDLQSYAAALVECGAPTIVFSGGDEAHFRLMRLVRAKDPKRRCIMLWHGNYVQLSDDYAFRTLRLWLDAARAGHVASIATVKEGMEKFFASLGVRSHFVLNYIRGAQTPDTPPPVSAPGTHLGLWMSGTLWKSPNVMLAAARLVPNARIHTAGGDHRTRELIEQFKVPTAFVSPQPLAHDELMRRMRQTHLTLYVTFTECCPMIPLESFAQGVPALVGPTSHLFEDDEFLAHRLIVPYPDRADIIANYIDRAIAERDAIVARYAQYAHAYNRRAARSVDDLLA